MSTLTHLIREHTIVSFFVLIFFTEGVVTLLFANAPIILPFALTVIPTAVALILANIEGLSAPRTLLRRVLLWRVRFFWYIVAVGLPALTTLIIILSGILAGFQTAPLGSHLTPALLFVFAVVLLPAFGEEIGFRGYVLPKMLEGRSALTASLLLGALWSLFHLPLFLPGQQYSQVPLWPVPFEIIGMAVLITWLFLHTHGSVLLTALFHASMNALTPAAGDIDVIAAWELRGIVLAALAVILVVIEGSSLIRHTKGQMQPTPQTGIKTDDS